MATNVADLVATLRMDAGQFNRTAQQLSGQSRQMAASMSSVGQATHQAGEKAKGAWAKFNQLGEKLQGLGTLAIGGFAAKQILDLGVAMYKVGMESEAFGRKYRAVFGENTAELDAWVEAHHEGFGVATDEVQGYLAQIGNLLTGMGMAADEAGQQATKILELAGAWSAWSGGQISVQDASDKLVKGMMGQTRGLIELGLKVTEQEVNARMAAQGLDELTGAEASRAQQQVMWTLIQEKSTTAVGAYDEALGGAYGAAMTMSTAVDEMKDRIGELVVKLAPAVTFLADLLGLATAFVSLDFSGVSEWVQANWFDTGISRMIDTEKMERQAALMEEMNAAFADGTSAGEIAKYEQAWKDLGYTQEHASGIVWGARDAIIQQGLSAARAADELRRLALAPVSDGRPATDGTPAVPLSFYWEQQVKQIDEAIKKLGRLVIGPVPNLFQKAFAAARVEVDKGFDAIGNAFTEFVIPDISLDDFMANMADWQTAQDNVNSMLDALGEHGLNSFASALMEGLSSEQLAYIASVWGGDLAALYALLPAYGPGGTKHPGSSNPPIEGQAAGGPVTAMTPYVVGERGPELFVPGASGSIVPNGRFGSGGGTTQIVNVHVAGSVIAAQELARIVEDQMIRSSRRGGTSEVY